MIKVYANGLLCAMASKKEESKSESNTTGRLQVGEYEQQSEVEAQKQRFQVSRVIDQTKESVRRSIEEARREIPQYAQSITDYHQQAMDSAEEITDNYLNSQKQIISSTQETWTNYLETAYWWMSPRKVAEMYTQAVSNFADNAVSATRILNKTVLANVDASKVYFNRAKEASRDVSRINVNTARAFEQTASQMQHTSGESDRYDKRSIRR